MQGFEEVETQSTGQVSIYNKSATGMGKCIQFANGG